MKIRFQVSNDKGYSWEGLDAVDDEAPGFRDYTDDDMDTDLLRSDFAEAVRNFPALPGDHFRILEAD